MKVLISDIETLIEFSLFSFYNPENNQWYEFEINKNTNDLYAFLSFVQSIKHEYHVVFYNGLTFDSQVIEFVLHNYDKWTNLTNLEITKEIWKFAQEIIDRQNYGLFSPFRQSEITLKVIDPYEINHYSNKNRLVSLKRVEFELDFENIEEMPIKHDTLNLTDEDLSSTKSYCRNDILALYEFYKVTIGDTEHPLYKGNNQIQLRKDIEEEFGVPCLNYSDSKIGDEIIKKFYCEEKGIEYKDLPKRGFFRKELPLKYCIAKYVKFQTPQLQEFLERIKNTTLKANDDFKEHIEFYGNKYSFMKGGIHTEQKPAIFKTDENTLIQDFDVSSFYPAIIINNGKYPYHLGKEFLKGYTKLFEKRLELKPLAKKDKKIKGIVDALKLSVNAVYGKSSDMQSWIYDRGLTMFTTITGELSLLMLIEAYEINGIHVISANTDGVTIQIDKSLVSKVEEVNKWWMNVTKYELERTDYSKMIFSTVNDYIAVKTDGSIKFKGDFLIDFELHKNKSFRIVQLALKEYFINNIQPEDFIYKHNNIYDFCARAKSTKDFHYEGVNQDTGEKTIYNKLIRYFISKEGEKLLKVKNKECQTNAASISEVNAGHWKSIVCNYLPKEKNNEYLCLVDYEFYLQKIREMIYKVENEGKKPKTKITNNPNQLGLF